MAFLSINGWEVQIRDDESSHHDLQIGDGQRAFDGDYRDTRRGFRRVWGPLTTPLLTLADAEQLEGLLNGKGWHVPFNESLYAATKLTGPATGYDVSTAISATQSKFGGYSCYLGYGVTGPTYAFGLTGKDYSVAFWQYVSGWKHYVIVYDADTAEFTEYVDGAAGAIDDGYRNTMVAGGSVVLMGTKASDNASSVVYYDDLVAVPYKFTSAMVTAIYTTLGGSSIAFSDLPYLWLHGDIKKATAGIAVRCTDWEASHAQARPSGTWSTQLRSYTFTLEAVDA